MKNLLFIFLFIPFLCFSQKNIGITMSNKAFSIPKKSKLSLLHSTIASSKTVSIPQAYSYNNLAFFCKMEVKIEKYVSTPIKFRLGSIDYANYLEGK